MSSDKITIIRDEPSELDEFHGEGHQRSAKALAYAVEQLSEKDGVIGLEGQWGSGKSTVIKLAELQLTNQQKQSDKKRHVFTFDLWLHHPDLLKVAFLEEFITWANTKKLLSDEVANKKLNDIVDREITTTIENNREFSLHGVIFILLAPLVPIAYTWLSPLAAVPGSIAQQPLFHVWGWPVGAMTIAATTLFILYAVFASAVIFKRVTKKVPSIKSALSAGARLFSKETDHDKIKQNIRERNPTNEEFQSFFREILGIVQKKKDRVVFVFDNIDRLPAETVAKAWSETRAIFSMRSRGKQPENSSVVAIVPYDVAYVSEVFKDDSNNQAHRAEHLIRKTFDITLRVAPPLSTDWRKFLDQKVSKALPQPVSEDDRYRIFKLFDVSNQENSAFPTPRNIITYVNDIAAIWQQWGDQIPISHIALYVLERRKIEAKPDSIKKSSNTNLRLARIIGAEDWHRSLAALHFNVDPQHAYPILLNLDIEKVATGSSTDAFVELSERSGFAEVFPDTIRDSVEQWSRQGADQLARLIKNMADKRIAGSHFKECWQLIAEAVPHLPECDTSDIESYIDIGYLIENLPPQDAFVYSRTLINWYSSHLPLHDELTSEDGENWLRFFGRIYSGLQISAGEESAAKFLKETRLPQGPSFSLGVCGAASDSESVKYNSFIKSDIKDNLRTAAVDLAKSDLELLKRVIFTPPWFIDSSFWPLLAAPLTTRLQTEQLSSEVRAQITTLLSIIRSRHDPKGKSKNSVAAIASDGTILVHALRAKLEDDAKTAGSLIWLAMESTGGQHPLPNPGNHQQFGDINQPHTDYSAYVAKLSDEDTETHAIASWVSASGSFGEWFSLAVKHSKVSVFSQTLRAVVAREDLNTLPTKDIVSRFDDLETILMEDLTPVFMNKFVDWSAHFQKHFSGPEALSISPNIMKAIATYEVSGLEGLGALLDTYFDSLQEEDWTNFFESPEDNGFAHLCVRIDQGSYLPASAFYRTHLMQHTIDILRGNIDAGQLADNWSTLFDGLARNTREKFARDLLIEMGEITTTLDGVEHFLATSGSFANELPFGEKPDITLDQLVTHLITSDDDLAAAFMQSNAKKFEACTKKAKPEVTGRLTEELQSLMRNNSEKAESIATLLGLDLPENELEEIEETEASPEA